MYKLSVLSAFFLYSVTALCGEDFPHRSTGFVKIQTVFGSVSSSYDHAGNKIPIDKFTFSQTSVMMDYPATAEFSFRLNWPVLVNHKQGKSDYSGSGDLVIGIDYYLNLNDKLRVIFSVDASLPTGKTARLDDPIPVSSNELLIHYHLGLPFVPTDKLNILVTAGYVSREEPNNSDLTASVSGRYKFTDRFECFVSGEYKSPIGSVNATPPNITGTANGVSYLKGLTGFDVLVLSDIRIGYGYSFAVTAANTAAFPHHSFRMAYLF